MVPQHVDITHLAQQPRPVIPTPLLPPHVHLSIVTPTPSQTYDHSRAAVSKSTSKTRFTPPPLACTLIHRAPPLHATLVGVRTQPGGRRKAHREPRHTLRRRPSQTGFRSRSSLGRRKRSRAHGPGRHRRRQRQRQRVVKRRDRVSSWRGCFFVFFDGGRGVPWEGVLWGWG